MKMKTSLASLPGILSLLLTVIIIAACDQFTTTPIANIINNPRDFDGKQVTIKGEVTDIFSLLIVKCFVIKDGTGELTVVSSKALPKKGTNIKVSGNVQAGFSLGDRQLIVLVEKEPQ